MIRYARQIASVVILLALIAATLGAAPGLAADVSVSPAIRPPAVTVLPFPRSERAQSVWASGTCQRECGSYCAWGQTSCLARDAQGRCLKLTDDCDRYCQRSCRTSGGPWLPLDF